MTFHRRKMLLKSELCEPQTFLFSLFCILLCLFTSFCLFKSTPCCLAYFVLSLFIIFSFSKRSSLNALPMSKSLSSRHKKGFSNLAVMDLDVVGRTCSASKSSESEVLDVVSKREEIIKKENAVY